MRGSVLLISTKERSRTIFSAMLRRQGYEVTEVAEISDAVELEVPSGAEVVLIDRDFADRGALNIVALIKHLSARLEIVLLADHHTPISDIEPIRDELFTFHTKPLEPATLDRTLQEAVARARSAECVTAATEANAEPMEGTRKMNGAVNGAVAEPPANGIRRNGTAAVKTSGPARGAGRAKDDLESCMIGESPAMQRVREQAREVAPTDLTVLLRGESGVGKGVVARYMHAHSNRGSNERLIQINCSAIPESLIESELFGYEAGAFTGADRAKPGRFEIAADGTIFLDEIGEITSSLQVKLLNIIEQKEIYHLGGKKSIRVSARFVTATNASLEEKIETGDFRADLFYRLNEFVIRIPPLRERIEDLPLLADHFCRIYGETFNRPGLTITPDVLGAMMGYAWPGNVRELESVIRRFALNGDPESILAILGRPKTPRAEVADQGSRLTANEIQTIKAALVENRWNQRKAAQRLGISYSALRRRIDKYRLKETSAHP